MLQVENVVDSKLRVLNKRLQNTKRRLSQLTITAVVTLKHLNCVTACVLCPKKQRQRMNYPFRAHS
jgi:hypothetical protein